MIKDWDSRFLDMAKLVSTWSKDPSTKVGAVIVDQNRRVVSTGYNGFPRGVMDSFDRLSNRDIKYEMIIHGEINAILFANQNLSGCTLYTYPFQPCSRCASIVAQTGITTVVSYECDNERWKSSFDLAKQIFEESEIELVLLKNYDL